MNFISNQKGKTSLHTVAYIVLLVTAVLSPLFFFPTTILGVSISKLGLLAAGGFLALVLYVLSVLQEKKASVPWHWVFFLAAAIPVSYLVSALLSDSFALSFLGYGGEIDTLGTIFFLFLLFILTIQIVTSKRKIFYSYMVFFTVFTILGLLQLARFIFGAEFLSLDTFFPTIASTPVGSWNNLAILSGIALMMALMTTEMISVTSRVRKLLYGVIGLAILQLIIVDYLAVWVLVGVSSLALFIFLYTHSLSKSNESPTISIGALSITLLALIFSISAGDISQQVYNLTDTEVGIVDVRPNLESTVNIAQKTSDEGLMATVFGTGPNTFANQWHQHKPLEINISQFWDTDFRSGTAFIPTQLTTVGWVGVALWLAFIITFIFLGVKSVLRRREDDMAHYLVSSSFFAGLFLWVMTVLYVPTLSLLILAMFFTGVFFALLIAEGSLIKARSIPLAARAQQSGVVVLTGLVALTVVTIIVGYAFTQQFISSIYAGQGVRALQAEGGVQQAEQKLIMAINAYENDQLRRTFAELQIAQVQQRASEILGSGRESATDEESQEIGGRAQQAISEMRAAIEYNPNYFRNHTVLGDILRIAAQYGMNITTEDQRQQYEQALELNPHSPFAHLRLAQIQIQEENLTGARESVTDSLGKKPNYVPAIFLLSQLEVEDGNIDQAVASIQQAISINPFDPNLRFQLGLLHYNQGNYQNAIGALESSIELSDQFSNARYFLGMSYSQEGRTQDALQAFERLQEDHPENTEIPRIINALEQGQDPLDAIGIQEENISEEPPIDEEAPEVEADDEDPEGLETE